MDTDVLRKWRAHQRDLARASVALPAVIATLELVRAAAERGIVLPHASEPISPRKRELIEACARAVKNSSG